MALLEVNDLHTSFFTPAGEVKAVNGVSFNLDRGKVLGIVGESGSGKSVTAYSVMQILEKTGKIVSGSIKLDGEELVGCGEKRMKTVRGNRVSIIFQDPMTSLNPTYTIGHQLMEAILLHTNRNKQQARERAIEMLRLVNVNEPEKRMNQYPFEFSGGMRQRVMIAIAFACQPKLLIADEPTTALDVTIQSQIIKLLKQLKTENHTSILMITHDLGVVASIAERIFVMYSGVIVEKGTSEDIFYRARHPYTKALLRAVPRLDGDKKEELDSIEGTPPDLIAPPAGCPFAQRCKYCMPICEKEMPEVTEFGGRHAAACWLHHEMAPKVEGINDFDEQAGKEV